MSTSLYELTVELRTALDLLSDPDIDIECIRTALECIGSEYEDKADNYARLIKSLHASAEALDIEIKRLDAREKMFRAREEWLKNMLMNSMIATNKTKFRTDYFSFSVAQNGGKAPLECDLKDDQIPEEFRKVSYSLDSEKVRDYLNDHTLEWARLKERGKHLLLK